jgi:hypothetical protein
VTAALSIALVGLLSATPASVAVDGSASAAVVVALPANANHAILEALNRLRGEATSVGFEVRFALAGTETVSPSQLESLGQGLRPAAVVAFSGSQSGDRPGHSLDVLFLDRATGKTSIEHFSVDKDDETEDRAEVIVAVRAVDFIRARMLDALVSRAKAPRPAPAPQPSATRPAVYAAAGVAVLGTLSGFAPSVAPTIDVAYQPVEWFRVGVGGFGFGSRPGAHSAAGEVELDQRYAGASATGLSPAWHRLRLAFELGGGVYWMRMRGLAKTTDQSSTDRLVSAAMVSSLGASWAAARHLRIEVRGGFLWLQEQGKIRGTETESLGQLGRPSWFASALVGVAY